MSEPGIKRKRPPTFQHFPAKRAKKLKETWVQNAKIRSKWKAERRKLTETSKLDLPNYENAKGEEEKEDEDKNSGHSDTPDGSEVGSTEESEPSEVVQSSNVHHSIHLSRPHSNSKRQEPPVGSHSSKQKGKGKEQELSVRELTRLAYSPSTLHTYKSDPLHRRRGGGSSRSREETRGREGGGGRGKGRGQPDMKLRMNAMLAKIKQDFGS